MQKNKTLQILAGGLALLILPLILQGFGNAWVRIADMALLYVLLALGLNIVVGYAGLLPFWERFIILHGKEVSVPQCDICMATMLAEDTGAKAPKEAEQ